MWGGLLQDTVSPMGNMVHFFVKRLKTYSLYAIDSKLQLNGYFKSVNSILPNLQFSCSWMYEDGAKG
jgi:hypothetical protein